MPFVVGATGRWFGQFCCPGRIRRRARFVVVGHHVDVGEVEFVVLSLFSSIATPISPVVHHVVAIIRVAASGCEPRVATGMMCDQVVVVSAVVGSPNAAETVVAFGMVGVEQTLCDHAPLDRDVFAVVDGHCFVNAPTGRHMIEDQVLDVPGRDRVGVFPRFIAKSDSDVSDDHFVSTDHQRVTSKADSVSRGGLASDGDVRIFDSQVAVQLDGSGHSEDDCSRSFRLHRGPQAALTGIVEVGHFEHLAAATARRVLSVSFCGRKGQWLLRGSIRGDEQDANDGDHIEERTSHGWGLDEV